jgi:hypothetical protein
MLEKELSLLDTSLSMVRTRDQGLDILPRFRLDYKDLS